MFLISKVLDTKMMLLDQMMSDDDETHSSYFHVIKFTKCMQDYYSVKLN